MFVDSLLINRWLCEDNIQHIVQTMMLLHTRAHTHSHHRMCARVCACSFFFKQSQVHLLISLFQKCAKAFQVREQGFLNRCHLVSTQHGAAIAKQNQLCFVAFAAEKGSISSVFSYPTSCILEEIPPVYFHGSLSPIKIIRVIQIFLKDGCFFFLLKKITSHLFRRGG